MIIELSKASNRNTRVHWVKVFDVDVLFSYDTAIAFSADGVQRRRHNDWGPTTGRHMNDASVRDWTEVEDEKLFESMIDKAILQSLSNRVARELAPREYATS